MVDVKFLDIVLGIKNFVSSAYIIFRSIFLKE